MTIYVILPNTPITEDATQQCVFPLACVVSCLSQGNLNVLVEGSYFVFRIAVMQEYVLLLKFQYAISIIYKRQLLALFLVIWFVF